MHDCCLMSHKGKHKTCNTHAVSVCPCRRNACPSGISWLRCSPPDEKQHAHTPVPTPPSHRQMLSTTEWDVHRSNLHCRPALVKGLGVPARPAAAAAAAARSIVAARAKGPISDRQFAPTRRFCVTGIERESAHCQVVPVPLLPCQCVHV
jgi:hypothetical protein